ncbi:MED4 [Candida metapsilosis]|uniref:Mediator of RNA polymerase II transcription subunit 4 n=1 Tax=Candida metapsilosis TaxID=273372 RepID=A0A8H7ZCA0_9ASCO|nr:MED4 [Candida metapsilosis]
MLPHQNSPLRSKPVSRVTSSTRLNQLSSGGAANNSSRPSTPYVPSSLNPLKYESNYQENIDDKVRSNEELQTFNALPIVSKIGDFRDALDTLSNSISHYKENEFYPNVERIVEMNTSLEREVHELSMHKERSREVSRLSNINKSLDTKLKDDLRTLVKLRADLKKLPCIHEGEAKRGSLESNVDVESILNYSMKLAKFTKAPAAVGNMSFQVHPNNYIWPAEDSLRRGMLAMSSLHASEIINAELSDGKEEIMEEKEDDNLQPEVNETTKEQPVTNNQKSESARGASNTENAQVDLDLDLFDPDDEYSD